MPMKPPRICGCGNVVAAGAQCACAIERERQRPSARRRGYNAKWERESKAFLALPGNDRCACGCGRIADAVDHIVAPKGEMAKFWDRKNWRPINLRCNSRKNVREEGGFGNRPKAVPGPRHDPPRGKPVFA